MKLFKKNPFKMVGPWIGAISLLIMGILFILRVLCDSCDSWLDLFNPALLLGGIVFIVQDQILILVYLLLVGFLLGYWIQRRFLK